MKDFLQYVFKILGIIAFICSISFNMFFYFEYGKITKNITDIQKAYSELDAVFEIYLKNTINIDQQKSWKKLLQRSRE